MTRFDHWLRNALRREARDMLRGGPPTVQLLRPVGPLAHANPPAGQGDAWAMTADWRRRFPDDPECFGGARPLHALSLLQEAGFLQVTRRYVGPAWPSEVLRGLRP